MDQPDSVAVRYGDTTKQFVLFEGKLDVASISRFFSLDFNTIEINGRVESVDASSGLTRRLFQAGIEEVVVSGSPQAGSAVRASTSAAAAGAPGAATVTGAGTGMLTAHEWVLQDLPMLCRNPTPRASTSTTKARHAKTFETLKPWADFRPNVMAMLESLKGKPERRYLALRHGPILESTEWAVRPADEAEVRGALIFGILAPLTALAKKLGGGAEYAGNGSNQAASFTDLLLRRAVASDPSQLSKPIMGVVEVKGTWQLDASLDLDLVEALSDKASRAKFLPALQQAFGDAVQDEAPLVILSNYEVTWFMRRSDNPADKSLLVSEPVPWNGSKGLPVLAAWLYMLQLADELWPKAEKIPLPVRKVPLTPECGYPVPPANPKFFMNARWAGQSGSEQAPTRSQPTRSTRHTQQPSKPARTRTSFDDGDEGNSSSPSSPSSPPSLPSPSSDSSGSGDSTTGCEWMSIVDKLCKDERMVLQDVLPVLSYEEVGYTDDCVSSTSCKRVFKGSFCGQLAALKVYDSHNKRAMVSFANEAAKYVELQRLQDKCIPRLLALGCLAHTFSPVLVLQWVDRTASYVGANVALAKHALGLLHGSGAAHGDVRPSNLLVSEGRVLLCDLETCVTDAEPEAMQADNEQLEGCLAGRGDGAS